MVGTKQLYTQKIRNAVLDDNTITYNQRKNVKISKSVSLFLLGNVKLAVACRLPVADSKHKVSSRLPIQNIKLAVGCRLPVADSIAGCRLPIQNIKLVVGCGCRLPIQLPVADSIQTCSTNRQPTTRCQLPIQIRNKRYKFNESATGN